MQRSAGRAIRLAALMAVVAAVLGFAAPIENLQPQTMTAYDVYVAGVETAFLARARSRAAIATSVSPGSAATPPDGRIVKVADGLVHHWRSAIHIPGVRLAQVLGVAQRYDDYSRIYAPIVQARLLERDGDTFVVLTRVRGGSGLVSAVLEVRSLVRYERQPASAYSLGASQDIREVVRAGESDEYLLPPGRDSGYLWRANTFTRFVERPCGVDVELETTGLSRRFPRTLAWLIEPIARRLGRRSVERTLLEFDTAVRTSVTPGAAPGPAVTPTPAQETTWRPRAPVAAR